MRFSYLQIMNQKSPEIATACKQHISVGFEHTTLNKDAAVTEEVSFPLFVELRKQSGQVGRHFHVYTQQSSV